MQTPQSDAGSAGIARARRRGLLGRFGGRGGVRRRAGMQFGGARVLRRMSDSPAHGHEVGKKEFFELRLCNANSKHYTQLRNG